MWKRRDQDTTFHEEDIICFPYSETESGTEQGRGLVEKGKEEENREEEKSLIVLVANDRMLNNLIEEVPEVAWNLFDESDTPITLILPGAKGLAAGVVAKDGTVAIRMINEGFLNRVITNFNKPIISTSANLSGTPTPISVDEVSSDILNEVDYVVNSHAQLGTGKPSSIVRIGLNSEIEIIRK